MALLQGDTYKLPIKISDCFGNRITDDYVVRAEFRFNELEKVYGEGGEVEFDKANKVWIVPFSQEETFSFKGVIKWQARFLFNDGSVKGIVPKNEYIYDSISNKILTVMGE